MARRSAAALECAITARQALTGAGLALDAVRWLLRDRAVWPREGPQVPAAKARPLTA